MFLIIVGYQNIENLEELIHRAVNAFEVQESERLDREKVVDVDLTVGQAKSRELYFCYQNYEKKSDSSTILANVGLACLGIRRLLQVNAFSTPGWARSHIKSRAI